MRKNIKRLVAVLVVMAMIISMCSTAFAAGHGSKKSSRGSYKSYTKEVTDQATDPVVEESADTAAPEDQAVDETAMPAQTFNEKAMDIEADAETDIEVSAVAEEGTFPADTTMSVVKVDPSEANEAVSTAVGSSVQDMIAVDITFKNAADEEIQPAKELKVTLSLAEALDEEAAFTVVDIEKDAETEELTCDVLDEEKVEEANAEGAVFAADSFTASYALVATEQAEETVAEDVIAENNTTEEAAKEEVADDSISSGSFGVKNAVTDAPATQKRLIDNGDGTYTLALSVTGATSSSSSTQVTKANVILVVDTSNSMNNGSGYTYLEYTTADAGVGTAGQNNVQYYRLVDGEPARVYWRNNRWRTGNNNNSALFTGTVYTRSENGTSRIEEEKDALTKDGGIIDNLLAQNVAGDPTKSDIIEVAVANFGTSGTTAQTFTTNADTLKSTINGLETSTGTNWEEGLMRAQELATNIKTSQPDEAVYVIFLTDGEPTTHNNSYNVNTNYATEWGYASDNAREIVTAGNTFYGLFTWGSGNSSHYLSSLVQYAYTGSGDSSSSLAPDYAKYFTDASNTEALIEALNQIVHDITVGVGYTNVELEDGVTSMTTSNVKTTTSGEITNMKYYRSGGSYSTTANNGLGDEWTDAPHASVNDKGEVDWDLGSLVLENGVTYTCTFVVWPSQESVDLVADLNNGIISYDSLTPDQKSQIAVSGGHHTLKTNTDYPTVTYSTVTTTTVDGQSTTVVSDPKTATITNPDPVGLAESKLNAVKSWEDTLDPSQREEIEDVLLYLLVDGNYYYVDENKEPLGVTLTEESEWTVTDYISIAPGLMVTSSSPAYPGDDVEGITYVTWEGTKYALLEKGHEYVFEESDINNHFELTAYTHHPMIMGENADGSPHIVDVVFTKDASGNITGIESVSNMGDNLSATNTLKGGINISKKVVDSTGAAVDTGDSFKVTINLTDADGNALPTKKTADDTEYTIDYRIYYGEKNPNYVEGGENRSAHIYKTGTSFDETLYVGDTIRVVNVENDALFNVTETLPDGSAYALDNVAYTIAYGTGSAAAYTDNDKVIKDSVTWYKVKGNSASYAEVTNKLQDVFYVYHSSDNTIERIKMTDNRVTNGKFNIVDETKSGYLYGGYYSKYELPALSDAGVMAAEYTAKEGSTAGTYQNHTGGFWAKDKEGKAYVGDLTSWNKADAYTVKGSAMTPVKNTVYYLKEVPDVYLQPATYVVYDERDVDEGNMQVKKLYQMTATDDANYGVDGSGTVGFDVVGYKGISDNAAFEADYCWGNQIDIVKNGTSIETLTATNLVNGHQGLIAARDVQSYLVSDAYYKFIPYHITPDNIKVNAVKRMTIYVRNTRFNTNWKKPAMTKTITSVKAAYKAL